MPLNLQDDTINEDEGMIGKIVHAAKMNHSVIKTILEENQAQI